MTPMSYIHLVPSEAPNVEMAKQMYFDGFGPSQMTCPKSGQKRFKQTSQDGLRKIWGHLNTNFVWAFDKSATVPPSTPGRVRSIFWWSDVWNLCVSKGPPARYPRYPLGLFWAFFWVLFLNDFLEPNDPPKCPSWAPCWVIFGVMLPNFSDFFRCLSWILT